MLICSMSKRTKIIELLNKGWTYQRIADTYKISRQRVHQIVTRYKGSASLKRKSKRINLSKLKAKSNYHSVSNQVERLHSKTTVLTHYGNGKLACVQCGFNDIRALSIDHINGDGYKDHITYKKLIESNFPPGYQTLCMNCQWLKRYSNKELH